MRILAASTFAVLLAMPAVAQVDPYMPLPDTQEPASSIQDRSDGGSTWRGAIESSQGVMPHETGDSLLEGRSSSDIPLPEDSGGSDNRASDNDSDDTGNTGPDGGESN